jgi:chemotaxis protein methyltransferase CheR
MVLNPRWVASITRRIFRMKDSEFDFIRRVVYQRSRINLSSDKRQLVAARLGKRLRATQLSTVAEYCGLLQSPGGGGELPHLIDAISTNHTYFFREPVHFDILRDQAVPALAGTHRAFRVWSAACSSGEEPYSIAITLARAGLACPWQIAATDISHRILAKATAAIYTADHLASLPAEVIRSHFERGVGPQAGNYRVQAALRTRVSFHHLNLLEGEPPWREPFQAIFCRNVMIYFDRRTQEELVTRLTRWLVPGGYLFVGHSESLTHLQHSLQSTLPAVYRRAA